MKYAITTTNDMKAPDAIDRAIDRAMAAIRKVGR